MIRPANEAGGMTTAGGKLRIDKWLWHARFFKTRTLAARQVSEGHVRVNGTRVQKSAHAIAPDDVLTFPQARVVRVVRVVQVGTRRGPADEARTLYEDLAPPEEAGPPPPRVGPRPTKKGRRQLDRLSDPDPQI